MQLINICFSSLSVNAKREVLRCTPSSHVCDFFLFEKKKSSKVTPSAFERKHFEEKFSYLYLTKSQYLSVYYFRCLQPSDKLYRIY